MSVARIASRYAKSLLELAIEKNKLEEVKSDIESFLQVTKQRDFYLLIKSPIVSKDKKKRILHAIFKDKIEPLSMSFLDILVRKHRESYMPEIAREFIDQYKTVKHISSVRLTTAVPMSDATVEMIRKKLEESAMTDEHVEIVTEVNPEIKGGFKLEFDHKLIDASLEYKLENLRKEFDKNLYISQIIAS